MTKEQLKQHLINEDFNLVDVIDAIIEINSLIGVGVISLTDFTGETFNHRSKDELNLNFNLSNSPDGLYFSKGKLHNRSK